MRKVHVAHQPILAAELRHQQRGKDSRSRARWLKRITRSILALGVLSALALFFMELASALIFDLNYRLSDADLLVTFVGHIVPTLLLLPLTALLDLLMIFWTFTRTSDAIARERRGGTWELLLLTSQTPGRIVLGKWGATVLSLAPLYGLLALLRIGVIVYIGLERYRINYFYYGYTSSQFFFETQPIPFTIDAGAIITGAALVTLFTFLNLGFTAALGVLVSVLMRGGNHSVRTVTALVSRTLILALPALLVFYLTQQGSNTESMYGAAFATSLLENGTLISAAYLTAPHHALNVTMGQFYSPFYSPNLIPYVLAFYLLLAAVSLWVAIRRVRLHS